MDKQEQVFDNNEQDTQLLIYDLEQLNKKHEKTIKEWEKNFECKIERMRFIGEIERMRFIDQYVRYDINRNDPK